MFRDEPRFDMLESDYEKLDMLIYHIDNALEQVAGRHLGDTLTIEVCELERIRDRLLEIGGYDN